MRCKLHQYMCLGFPLKCVEITNVVFVHQHHKLAIAGLIHKNYKLMLN